MKSSKIRAALNPRRERGPDLNPRRSPERPPEVGADITSNELRLFGEHSQALSILVGGCGKLASSADELVSSLPSTLLGGPVKISAGQ
jgi:hypothetical protein